MHGTISGGFGGHQVGHIHLLLLPLTNIVPPLLKQQDPALSLSPPPPWWFWCWRLDSLQTNSLFVCLRSPEWKVVRKGRQPDSLLLVLHKVHPEADHIQADLFTSSYILSSLLRRFPSNILFPSAPPVQKVEVGRVAAAGGGRGKLPPAAGRLAFQLSN